VLSVIARRERALARIREWVNRAGVDVDPDRGVAACAHRRAGACLRTADRRGDGRSTLRPCAKRWVAWSNEAWLPAGERIMSSRRGRPRLRSAPSPYGAQRSRSWSRLVSGRPRTARAVLDRWPARCQRDPDSCLTAGCTLRCMAIDPRVDIGHVSSEGERYRPGARRSTVTSSASRRCSATATAAFISAGGYHHHIGLNTWESKGGSPPPPGTTGSTTSRSATRTARRSRRRSSSSSRPGIPLSGATDPAVSGDYLRDPDATASELYRDRAPDEWPRASGWEHGDDLGAARSPDAARRSGLTMRFSRRRLATRPGLLMRRSSASPCPSYAKRAHRERRLPLPRLGISSSRGFR